MTAVDDALDQAAEVLRAAPSVALACHINPDPDAAGSMLGLAHLLSSMGKEVVCSWGNQPLRPPHWLGSLDGERFLVQPDEFPQEPDLMVALDTAAPDRLGALEGAARKARQAVVIDHHRTNPGFGTTIVLDPEASSTCELVFRLSERLGVPLPEQAAACLYAGLIADTGRFQYEATTPQTLRVGAALREYPFDHARLSQLLFEDNPAGYLRALAVALDRAVLVPERSLIWTYLTQADLRRAGITASDTDDLMDVVRTAREVDVAAVFKQQSDGRFKASLRSRGATDVSAVAQRYGGGGHRLAAGYTAPGGLDQALRDLVEALPTVDGPSGG